MIYGNIQKLESFSFLTEEIRRCLCYAKSRDLMSLEKGRYNIDGDDLFFRIVKYKTGLAQERKFEAHKAYVDIHYMIKGTERIDISFVSEMRQGEYDKENDDLSVEGIACASMMMREGDFLICYPEDGHCVGIQAEHPEEIKKAVFKVKI